jgi:hypothetical protein
MTKNKEGAVISNFFFQLKRISFDLLGILSIVFVFIITPNYFFSELGKAYTISLILTKFICISCGIIHFQITRKLLFPYIKFNKETDWSNNLMIIAMFVVMVWGWARGG